MSTPTVPPLPPDVRALLDRATDGPGPTVEQIGRLQSRIGTTIAGRGGGRGGGTSAGAAGGSGAAGSVLAIVVIAGLVGAIAWLALRPSEPIAPMIATTTAPDHAGRSPLPAQVKEPDSTSPIAREAPAREPSASPSGRRGENPGPLPSPPSPQAEATLPPTASSSRPPRRRAEPAPVDPEPAHAPTAPAIGEPSPAPIPTDRMARERVLVEAARKALSARELSKAIERLDTHQAEFPDGQLAEEREALMIQALVLVDNRLAAAARARAFRVRYPNSIFLELVDAVAPTVEPPSTQER